MTASPAHLRRGARAAKPADTDRLKVPVHDRLRWSLAIAAAVVDLCPNTVRDLIRRGEFPPRIAVEGKKQFVPAEVRAWADGKDWRGLVAARQGPEAARAS